MSTAAKPSKQELQVPLPPSRTPVNALQHHRQEVSAANVHSMGTML